MDSGISQDSDARTSTLDTAVAVLKLRHKQLRLDKEPLRTLTGAEMQRVGGGHCVDSKPA
jgi:hypothetical protein